MKTFLHKHYKKMIVLSADVLCILAVWISKPLSEALLQKTDKTCLWTVMGGQCPTCGGTHFVNDLLSGRIGAAFADNQFLFIATAYLAVSLIVLNLWLLFDLGFAKKMLGWMYNIPSLIVWGVGLLVFLIVRNLPMLGNLLLVLESQS